MILRALRGPGRGPSPLAQIIAVVVIGGMVLSLSPLVVAFVRWTGRFL